MHDIIHKIALIGIVPVIKVNNVDDAVPLAKALRKGGVPVAEVTFRTAAAAEAIRKIRIEVPDVIVGAGTVLNTQQVEIAINAGAQFIVSPGFNPEVVECCIKNGIPITPGCTDASDIERAIGYGLEVVKFFPAEASGGIKMIKALAGPFGNLKFMPTGGIDDTNLNDYLSNPNVIACGGSWMAPEDLINAGNFDQIEVLVKDAVKKMLGFRIAHVGINCSNESDAKSCSHTLSEMFGYTISNGNSSYFAGKEIELLKQPYIGINGHIAIKTNYIDRAVNYLINNGFEIDSDTAKYDSNEKLKAIYLKQQVGGFGIHLVE